MAEITAADVKALREETGLPMMECKGALTEAGGDKGKAIEILALKHKGKMESRADRETGEGRIAVYIDESGTRGGIVELRCETAPVAKNEVFIDLAVGIARQVVEQEEASPAVDAILASRLPEGGDRSVSDAMTEVYGKLRETMKLASCRRVEGAYLTSYVHHDGKSGVLIALDAKPGDEAAGLDLCHHATFSRPMAITRDQISAEAIEKVRAQAREIALAEGKPEAIVDKIVEGKVNAYCAENSLMEQEHVKVSKTKVRDVLKAAGVSAVTDLVFMHVGA